MPFLRRRRSALRSDFSRGLLRNPAVRATSAAVDSAFNTLAQTVLVQNARTLEDLVREMLRPMLKSGSTTISPAWWSAWSAPRSSASRAAAWAEPRHDTWAAGCASQGSYEPLSAAASRSA